MAWKPPDIETEQSWTPPDLEPSEVSRVEVPPTYGGSEELPTPMGSFSDFMEGVSGGLGRSMPGGSMLMETEPRVIAEEKEFVPLLGRIPVLGKMLEAAGITQTTPTKRQALVWAPPGTEEEAREMYPEANIQMSPSVSDEDRQSLESLRSTLEGAQETKTGKAGAIIGELAGRTGQSALLTPAISGLPAWQAGMVSSAPWATERLEQGNPAGAAFMVGMSGLTAGVADMIMKYPLFKYLPEEAKPVFDKLRRNIKLTPKELDLAERSVLEMTKLGAPETFQQIANAYTKAGLSYKAPVIETFIKSITQNPRIQAAASGGLTGGITQGIRSGGDPEAILKGAGSGAALGSTGRGVGGGIGRGALPVILQSIMGSGGGGYSGGSSYQD